MTTVIYARQSLDRDGTGAAVDRQLEECRDLAQRLGLTIDQEIVDNDVSATKGVRPGFVELLAGVAAGSITEVIVWHTDRLYRRVRDLIDIVELAEKGRLVIRTVKAGDLDLGTPAGRMLAGILGTAARYEVEQKGARQVASNIQRAKAGTWQFSLRPFGYERINGVVTLVPHEAEILRDLYRRYIAGESFYALAADLNARGVASTRGTGWTTSTVKARLENPAYAGIRLYKGEEVAVGDWEPVIDRATWDAFTRIKSRRKVRHDWGTSVKHLLSGLLVCGVCGSRLMARPDYATKDNRIRYACTGKWCVQRDARAIEGLVEAVVIARLRRPDALRALAPTPSVEPLIEESRQLVARRADLAALLAEGLLSATDVREQGAKIVARLEHLQGRIEQAQGVSGLSELLLAESIEQHWRERLSIAQRRQIITSLMTVTVHRQKSTRGFDPSAVTTEWVGVSDEIAA